MTRYVIIRLIWVCIVLVTFLSLLFIVIQLVPQYPPADVKQRSSYYQKEYVDGYYTVQVVLDPHEVNYLMTSTNTVCQDKNVACIYSVGGTSVNIYRPVPILTQYVRFVRNVVLHWDWGTTTRVAPVGQDVWTIFGSRIGITAKLNVISLFLLPIGFIFGTIAALKKDKFVDNIIMFGVMLFISIPNFVLMIFLIYVFGYYLHWVPFRFVAADVHNLNSYTDLILPVLGLSFGPIAFITRLLRAELTEVLTSEFVLLARTKGLSKRQAVIRHAIRNSMVPLVPTVIGSFLTILTGSVVIEQVYSIAGAGQMYLEALHPNSFDYNMIMASTAFYTVIGLLATLMVDMSYGIVDPRIRMGARR